jgi:hypothetical protein
MRAVGDVLSYSPKPLRKPSQHLVGHESHQ